MSKSMTELDVDLLRQFITASIGFNGAANRRAVTFHHILAGIIPAHNSQNRGGQFEDFTIPR